MSNVADMTVDEARRHLIDAITGMDVDDLAMAVSELGLFEDRVVVVRGGHEYMRPPISYAYLNGMGSDKRGDVACFSEGGE